MIVGIVSVCYRYSILERKEAVLIAKEAIEFRSALIQLVKRIQAFQASLLAALNEKNLNLKQTPFQG